MANLTWQDGKGRLKKGNPGGKGGPQPNSGRDPDWLKAKCREIVEKRKLVEFLGKVADGEDIDQVVTDQGECLKVPASVKDRLRATEMLVDRGWGRPKQEVEVDGGLKISLLDLVQRSRGERGLGM